MILGPETEQYAGGAQRPWSLARIASEARRCEDLGFDGITSAEAGHDPFLPLAVAAGHTTRVTLGTNVAIAFPRSPMVSAQLAWDLQQLSGGRFQLGLGTQVKPHVERRYGATWNAPPVRACASTCSACRRSSRPSRSRTRRAGSAASTTSSR